MTNNDATAFIGGFQSRAGFSECLDGIVFGSPGAGKTFQSRAGFSECLDSRTSSTTTTRIGFNPVLGFLSVSTFGWRLLGNLLEAFQSRAGFSECLD